MRGHLGALDYAHAHGCPRDERAIEGAIKAVTSTPCNGSAITAILGHGVVRSSGHPWRSRAIGPFVRARVPLGIRHDPYPGRPSFSDCLRRVRESGCPWAAGTSRALAAHGLLAELRYAHENGCAWDDDTCARAASRGHWDCVRYARDNGCAWPCGDGLMVTAASAGNLATLVALHKCGCPWGTGVTAITAHNGHLACMRYAHENGCPWDENTCTSAAHRGSFECLRYALEHGCPWEPSINFVPHIHGADLATIGRSMRMRTTSDGRKRRPVGVAWMCSRSWPKRGIDSTARLWSGRRSADTSAVSGMRTKMRRSRPIQTRSPKERPRMATSTASICARQRLCMGHDRGEGCHARATPRLRALCAPARLSLLMPSP
ncbi:ankyrin repeat domain containing protein [Pandoravirus celtis]|uniref:Ankyrin repeat domain containing protein n=1 Tax=Pandoravirus celtis TaxID=2568002 RepID=A0A4D6EJ00_9VIRU|nr:ankyrin repeat domain containing protein [Pandoravirus celtis]